jgi:hypothetical protein
MKNAVHSSASAFHRRGSGTELMGLLPGSRSSFRHASN